MTLRDGALQRGTEKLVPENCFLKNARNFVKALRASASKGARNGADSAAKRRSAEAASRDALSIPSRRSAKGLRDGMTFRNDVSRLCSIRKSPL